MFIRLHVKHSIALFVFVCLFFSLFTFTGSLKNAHAQSFYNEAVGLHLIPTPRFPSPHTPVTVTLDDYSVETVGSTIQWYVNDIERKDALNERSLNIESGNLGKKTAVRVLLTRKNALPLSTSIDIIPSVVDIILEANTYTPDFYKGRALPSTESIVRAIAVVHDGTENLQNAYSYKWTQGDTVLGGGARTGGNVVNVTIDRYADDILELEVFNTAGETVGRRSIPLIPTDPEIHFYEQSPLRGLSGKEINNPFKLIGDETTIYGEPYFFNTKLNESDADFTWTIDSTPTTHDTNVPNAIALRHIGGAGEARIGFSIISKGTIPQVAGSLFNLIFE